MEPKKSLERRIKRHVTGRVRTYFAVTAPGLEPLCRDELAALPLSEKELAAEPGGVVFRGRLIDCYVANLCLRTANRVLMRIDEFKASGFGRLEKKLADIPWGLYLHPGVAPVIHVTSKKSRLYHKGAVAERFQDALSKHPELSQVGKNVPPKSEQNIYIRIVDDRFTVSLDSSGDILHKRGIKTHGGKAPLRETLAAAILMLAGHKPGEPLVDPMCGSGTFSVEACMMTRRIPAGWFRNFAFMDWPSFMSASWAHEKRVREREFAQPERLSVFASDSHKKNCQMLVKTLEAAGMAETARVSHSDFFELSPSELADAKGLVVLNPPYGLRMGTRAGSMKLFENICGRLEKEYAGWKFALVAPDAEFSRKVPFEANAFKFKHGGGTRILLTGLIEG